MSKISNYTDGFRRQKSRATNISLFSKMKQNQTLLHKMLKFQRSHIRKHLQTTISVWLKWCNFSLTGKKTLWKMEEWWQQAFFPFPTMFPKDFLGQGHLKL